jgi:hypothetical protein
MQQITNLEYSKRNIITKKIETFSPKQMACKGVLNIISLNFKLAF